MKGSFQFLGTSASAGIPVIGCKCAVCKSESPKDRRFRPSGLVQVGGKKLLIDIGPDFRSQALQNQIEHLDGLLLTHTHYDHIAGIDELRIFNHRQKKPFPCLLSQESLEELRKRYYYFFEDELSTKLHCTILEGERGEVRFLDVKLSYCSYFQGPMKVNGFRFGDFAYIADAQSYDDSLIDFLKGVRVLVLNALRPDPSPYHLSFADVVAIAQQVEAEQTWITHLGHFLQHEAMDALLPDSVKVAYDGLKLEFTCMS